MVVAVGDDLFLKAYLQPESGAFEREAAALDLLGRERVTVAVPAIVGRGVTGGETPWLLMTKVPGSGVAAHPVDTLAALRHYRARGRVAGALHAVGTGVFGRATDPAADGFDHYRWRINAFASGARTSALAASDVVDAAAAAAFDRLESVRRVTQPVLVHRDLGHGNVLVTEEGAVGVIDFEEAAGGDPLDDLRWVGLHGIGSAQWDAFVAGYDDVAPLHLDEERLELHLLVVALQILCRAGATNSWLLDRAMAVVDALATGRGLAAI